MTTPFRTEMQAISYHSDISYYNEIRDVKSGDPHTDKLLAALSNVVLQLCDRVDQLEQELEDLKGP